MEFLAGALFIVAFVVIINAATKFLPKKDDKIHLSKTRRRNLELGEKRKLEYTDTDSYPKP